MAAVRFGTPAASGRHYPPSWMTYPIDLYPRTRLPYILISTGTFFIYVIVYLNRRFPSYDRWSLPAYCWIVPLHEIGSVRNKVSRSASSKPSPMYLPVATITRSSESGIEASFSLACSRCFSVRPPHYRVDVIFRTGHCITSLLLAM